MISMESNKKDEYTSINMCLLLNSDKKSMQMLYYTTLINYLLFISNQMTVTNRTGFEGNDASSWRTAIIELSILGCTDFVFQRHL